MRILVCLLAVCFSMCVLFEAVLLPTKKGVLQQHWSKYNSYNSELIRMNTLSSAVFSINKA